MASLVTSSITSATILHGAPRSKSIAKEISISFTQRGTTLVGFVPSIQVTRSAAKSSPITRRLRTKISCSIAKPETLEIVQTIIAKQLSLDQSTVTPQTKFADLGADSLDTVEIMMALEDKFNVSVGEAGVENIATVQDAANLIEKVKTANA